MTVNVPSDKESKVCIINEILDLLNEEVCSVVELVYKSDEKSTGSVRKGESTAKMPFKFLGVTYIATYIQHIYMWTPTPIT